MAMGIYASIKGHLKMVRLLLSHGAKVNHADDQGITALMYASMKGYLDLSECLLNYGAEINATDKHERTAFFYACNNAHIKLARFLQERRADIYKMKKYKKTSFMEACFRGDVTIAECLLSLGTDIKEVCNEGNMTFYEACQKGHLAVAQLLLKQAKGLDVNQTVKKSSDTFFNGSSPLFIATYMGHIDIVYELLSDKRTNVYLKTNDGHRAVDTVYIADREKLPRKKTLTDKQKADLYRRLSPRGLVSCYI
jgi:ankyrin repeat protein